MRRTATCGIVTALALAITGCTGDDDPTGDPSSSGGSRNGSSSAGGGGGSAHGGPYGTLETTTPRSDQELGRTRTGPRGEYFVLTGLRRLGTDRVVVEGRAKASATAGGWGFFNEPGYTGVKYPFGGDFASVTLTRKGDTATYLPVRNADRSCLCTAIPANHDGGDEIRVFVVMTAPEANDGFTVTVNELGPVPGQQTVTTGS